MVSNTNTASNIKNKNLTTDIMVDDSPKFVLYTKDGDYFKSLKENIKRIRNTYGDISYREARKILTPIWNEYKEQKKGNKKKKPNKWIQEVKKNRRPGEKWKDAMKRIANTLYSVEYNYMVILNKGGKTHEEIHNFNFVVDRHYKIDEEVQRIIQLQGFHSYVEDVKTLSMSIIEINKKK